MRLCTIAIVLAFGASTTTQAAAKVDSSSTRKLIDDDFLETDAGSLTAGHAHTCALDASSSSGGAGGFGGQARCWGSNRSKQCDVPLDVDFVQIAAGKAHTCGVDISGALNCWGNCCRAVPEGEFAQVCTGNKFSCALRQNGGQVVCWGGGSGNTGTGNSGTEPLPLPRAKDLDLETGFVQVACGEDHACAIRGDGSVQCWGNDRFGQTQAPTDETIVQISCGKTHSCAVTIDRRLICWGDNSFGQGTLPTAELQSVTFAQVSCGDDFTCALLNKDHSETAELICAGRTSQLDIMNGFLPSSGNNNDGDSNEEGSGGSGLARLAAGKAHVCTMSDTGQVECSGADTEGSVNATPNAL